MLPLSFIFQIPMQLLMDGVTFILNVHPCTWVGQLFPVCP